SGYAIPIGIGGLLDRQPKPRTAEVVKVKRCDDEATQRGRKPTGTQAQSDRASTILRWLL
ncbi:MAG: hypothetical protein ACRENP_22275, partial [Longimicrobiales bacterium]